MKSIYRYLSVLLVFTAMLFASNESWAQLYVNTFTGTGACPTQGNTPTVATNATGAALSRSTITCTTANNVANSTTLNVTSSVNTSSYLEFSVTANAGYQLNLTSMSFLRQGSASAPNQLDVRYSTNGFTSNTAWGAAPVTPTAGTVATWDFTDFSTAAGGTVTFRIYPYGTTRCDLTTPAVATGTFRVDDVTINGTVTATTPTITLSSPSQVSAANQNVGTTGVVLSQFQSAVTVANATLNSVAFTTGGTYVSGDLAANSFKLYYNTTNTMPGSPISTQAVVGNGNTVTFGSLSQAINSGVTGYYWITADISGSASAGNTISAGTPTLTFASGTPTGTISAGGTQTITALTPTIVLSDPSQVSAASQNTGTTNVVLNQSQAAVSVTNATLNSVSFVPSGTYVSGDLVASSFKLYYNSTNTMPGSPISTQAIVSSGATVTFGSLTQNIPVGTGYFWITVDVSGSATAGNTIIGGAPSFTFASGTPTGTISAGGAQTFAVPVPTISLANGTIAAANINQNTTNNVLYRNDVTVSVTAATLNSITFTTASGYTASDVSNFKVWYSTVATFATGTSTLLGTISSSLGAGTHTLSALSQSFAVGTAYIYITTDLPCAATLTNTVTVNAPSTSDFTFASGTPTTSGFTAGGTQTIIAGAGTPANATGFTTSTVSGNGVSGQISASWTAPAGCYDEIMIVAGTVTNATAPTGNGSAYTANAAYGAGTAIGSGFVLYKGTSAPQTFTGFTNGSLYFIKIYTRYNSTWSTGVEVSNITSYTNTSVVEVAVPQYMEGISGTNGSRIPSAFCMSLLGWSSYL